MGSIIFDQEEITSLDAAEYDHLWSEGWRHFGRYFFRYNLSIHQGDVCQVLPLRIHLPSYQHRKSYRKILRRAKDFTVKYRPLSITPEMISLFQQHKERFKDNIPDSIEVFLTDTPEVPRLPMECAIYDKDRLIAVSFFDEGLQAFSSIYGMFDPEYAKYSLGTLTMLEEINYAIQQQKTYYYHGYCYDVSSFYDYKKYFPALEAYNWHGKWIAYGPDVVIPFQ